MTEQKQSGRWVVSNTEYYWELETFFDTREDAVRGAREALALDPGDEFYTGQAGLPPKASDAWPGADWLMEVMQDWAVDEHGSDAVADWPDARQKDEEDLDRRMVRVIDEWATERDLQPKFYEVHDIRKHVVPGG